MPLPPSASRPPLRCCCARKQPAVCCLPSHEPWALRRPLLRSQISSHCPIPSYPQLRAPAMLPISIFVVFCIIASPPTGSCSTALDNEKFFAEYAPASTPARHHWHPSPQWWLPFTRRRYETELSSNYGDGYAGALAASKKAVCSQGGGAADAHVVYFYGERTGGDCGGSSCFPHRYGGGVRMFEFLNYEIEGGAQRFVCPSKTDDGV